MSEATKGIAAAPHPRPVSDLDVVFGNCKGLMPEMGSIPNEFRHGSGGKWNKVFQDFFYLGAKDIKWTPKDGVDARSAARHIRAIMGSFEPKHEHKEAACAYLMSLWFEDVTYKVSHAR